MSAPFRAPRPSRKATRRRRQMLAGTLQGKVRARFAAAKPARRGPSACAAQAREKFPKYVVVSKLSDEVVRPTLEIEFVDGKKEAWDVRRQDFDEICRRVDATVAYIRRSDEETGTVREGVDFERD